MVFDLAAAQARRVATRLVLVGALVSALAGCGGGGGSSDTGSAISGTYQLDGLAELGVASSIRAEMSQGVAGTPRCSLVSGTVPPGMAFGTDCSLAGTPSQIGVFTSRLTLSVSGHPGSATVNVQMVVGGPVLQQTGPLADNLVLLSPLVPSEVLGVFAQSLYTVLAGDAITYAVVSGSLPTGLALDPATGKVAGTPVALGSFEVTLSATLRRNGQDYALNSVPLMKNVIAPFGSITYDAICCDLNFGVVALQTPEPSFLPALPAGARASFEPTVALPAGLAMDPATGIIAGRTLRPGVYQLAMRGTVTTAEGAVYSLEMPSNFWRLNIQGLLPYFNVQNCTGSNFNASPGMLPAHIEYTAYRFPLGTVCTYQPGEVFGGLPGDVYAYELIPNIATGDLPPTWVSVDPVTGVVSARAPEAAPGHGATVNFGLQVTTRRGADTIVSKQSWTLVVQ